MKFTHIPVAFDDRMSVDARSYSKSPLKPGLVVEDWLENKLPIEIIDVRAATSGQIQAAHHMRYVSDVLSLRHDNGFGSRSDEVNEALLFVIGSMLAAATRVCSNPPRTPVACSPSSGFHHASFSHGAGFCTFNGLVITAMAMKRLGLAKRVAIIDCDYHYGDGTQDIIDHLGLQWINHWSAGIAYRDRAEAAAFMRELPLQVKHTIEDADLVLYQAGADQHVDDPLGGLLTTEQMLQRDRDVFYVCREYGKPLVWNLAGGYQRGGRTGMDPVITLHRNTMQACVDIYLKDQERRA